MTWTSTPDIKDPPVGGGWTSQEIGIPNIGYGDWFARLEKAAQLTGSGALSVLIGPVEYRPLALSGEGKLDTPLTIINYRSIVFGGLSYTWASALQTKIIDVPFSGRGFIESMVNDGLHAVTYDNHATRFNGEGSLSADTAGGWKLGDGLKAGVQPIHRNTFASGGSLIAGIAAVPKTPIIFAGSGDLTVKVAAKVNAALSGGGSLAATAVRTIYAAAAFSGSGDLTEVVSTAVFKGAATSNTTSVTLPAHAPGDTIIIFAYRAPSAATIPGKPGASGNIPAWVDINSGAVVNGSAARYAYFVATSSTHTSGSWTSATAMAAVVLSGRTSPGGHGMAGGNSYAPTTPDVTLSDTTGGAKLLEFYGAANTSGSWLNAPTGYTRRAATNNYGCINTKDDTSTDGAIAQPISSSAAWIAATVEMVDA